jgi:hypothetical protein
MKTLFLILTLALVNNLSAESVPAKANISGRIIDANDGFALEFATVSAFDSEEVLVTGESTDSTGRFSLHLPKGEYKLRFEFIGYSALDTMISVSKDLDIGDITLFSSAIALEGATVTAERSRLTLKLDKQIFDVGADIISQGGTANEVLDNVPMITVSPDGVVSLRGNSSVKVLINGKPSALADNNALQGIPAANIAKVEIMTSPSARFEASGTAGIINIILKDDSAKNGGGQVSASVGIPVDYRLNGSFTRSEKKWTYFANAGLRYSNYFSTGDAERISFLPTGTQILREDLDQDRNDRAGHAFGGVDFRPTDKTTFSASYSLYHQTNDDLSEVNYNYFDGSENLERDWLQRYDYLEPETYHQIEASYAQDFSKEGTKLFVLFQNDFWKNDEQELTIISERFPLTTEALRLRTRDIESSNDYLLQGDYEQKLGAHGKLEIGLRGESRIISSDYLAEIKQGDEFQVYRGLENLVDYYERIAAGYIQYAFEKNAWGVQVGLRSEYTNVRVEDTQAETADIEKSYNWVFPSATVSYKFSGKLNTSLGYSKRIQRPRFSQLNPFGGIENPNELRFGNADLDPSFRDHVELKVLYNSDQLTVSPYLTAHFIDGFYDTQVLQDSSGLVTYFPINLDQERILEAGLIVTYEPVKGWQFNGETRVAEFKQRGVYEGVDYGNSFQTFSAELGLRGKLPKDVRIQATFYYYGGQRYLQSFRDPFYGINAGLSRNFLSDRLQVTLNVRNLFALSVYEGGATLPTFTNSYSRQWQGQRIGLTVAWDIGADVRVRRARGSIR